MAEENKLIPFLTYKKNWRRPEDFPTYEPSEERVRDDMQYLYDEIQKYLNDHVAGTLCQALQQHMAAPVVTAVTFSGVSVSGDDFTLTLDATTSDGKVTKTSCQMKDVAEAVRGVIGSGLKSVTYDPVGFAWVFTYTDGKVDRVEMPASERNSIAWTALDTPGSAHNPSTGYAVGLQWLRPAYTVKNHALANWAVTKGSVANGTNSWTFTADSGSGSIQVSQNTGKIGEPGQKVHVQLLATGISSTQSSLVVNLNEVNHNLRGGGGVFESTLDSAGRLIITVTGSWSYSASAATVVLQNLVVVSSGAIEAAAVGCRPMADWGAFIRAHAPFTQINMNRALFVQESPGNWAPVQYDVLPVNRGGTGFTQAQSGALLLGNGGSTLQTLAPGTNGRVLQMVSGKPAWSDITSTVQGSGFLRYTEGSYAGNSAERTITLPVTPKIIWVGGPRGVDSDYIVTSSTDEFVVMMPGSKFGVDMAPDVGGNSSTTAKVYIELSGNQLKFTAPYTVGDSLVYRPKFLNRTNYNYKWFALY